MTAAEDVLAGLDPEQREVAEALRGPVCVLAGAGTGKTRAITHRIAYGVRCGLYVPQNVLAVTFTARAAGEMRSRLHALGAEGVQARTFHSAALRQLRYFWPDAIGGEQPRIADSKAPLVAEAASRQRLRPDAALVRDLAAEIEWAKVSRISADSYAEHATGAGRTVAAVEPALVGRVYAAYDDVKRRRGLLDFEDVLLFVVGMLEETPRIAAQVRGQYRQLIVDEYQDVSPLQQRLLELWLGDREELCVVGDPSQTIYSFAGADQRYLLDFPSRHPGATVVRLERNYRSTAPILALANAVLSHAVRTGASGRRGSPPPLRLVSQRGDGPKPTLSSYADEPAEATAAADAIAKLVAGGTPPREIAVLFRINAQGVAYEQALGEAGIPYVVRGSERFFDRAEVKQAVTLLRGAARAVDGVVRGPGVIAEPSTDEPSTDKPSTDKPSTDKPSTDKPSTDKPSTDERSADERSADERSTDERSTDERSTDRPGLAADVSEVLVAAGWSREPPAGTGAVRTRWESLRALADLASDIARERPDATLTDFVTQLEARAAVAHAPVADGVTLATLHAAKGLEWDVVFLVGLVDGTLPLVHAESAAEVEEEARLLYVGLTRARDRCVLSWASARNPGGRASRSPSRFLDRAAGVADTQPGALAGIPAASPRTRKSRAPSPCRVCGRTLFTPSERKLGRCEACPSSADERVFDKLREWRSAVAKEAALPAYCVFTDSTLLAIAETMPESEADLAKIPGVGRVKLARYGRTVLDLCGDGHADAGDKTGAAGLV